MWLNSSEQHSGLHDSSSLKSDWPNTLQHLNHFLLPLKGQLRMPLWFELYTERLVCDCRPEYKISSRCFGVCKFHFFQCWSTMRACVCMFIQVGSNETIHWNSSWSVHFKFRTFNYIYGGWSYWFKVLWTSASSTESTLLELLWKAWLLYCFLLLWSYRPVEMPGGQAWRDEATIWYSKVAHSTIGAVSVCSKSSCQVGGS